MITEHELFEEMDRIDSEWRHTFDCDVYAAARYHGILCSEEEAEELDFNSLSFVGEETLEGEDSYD